MDNPTFPPCPHCGAEGDGFSIKGTMSGPSESFYDSDGKYQEMSTDNLFVRLSDAIRCGKCYKIRRDVARAGDSIVAK